MQLDADVVRKSDEAVEKANDQTRQAQISGKKTSVNDNQHFADAFQIAADVGPSIETSKDTRLTTKVNEGDYAESMAVVMSTTGEPTTVKYLPVITAEDLKVSEKDIEKMREWKSEEALLLLHEEIQPITIHDVGHSCEIITQSREKSNGAKIDTPQEGHLSEEDETSNFDAKDLLSFAWQVARGMVSGDFKYVLN